MYSVRLAYHLYFQSMHVNQIILGTALASQIEKMALKNSFKSMCLYLTFVRVKNDSSLVVALKMTGGFTVVPDWK